MSDYDVAVIGGGAAGLSAALVLSRARRMVLGSAAGIAINADLVADDVSEAVRDAGSGLPARPPAAPAPARTP